MFEVLLHEATLRLPARPADLPSIEIHRTTVESDREFGPEPFASSGTDDRDRGSHLDARLSTDDAEPIRESAPESTPESAPESTEASAPSADDARGEDARGEDNVTLSTREAAAADQAGETLRETNGDVRTTEDESGEPAPEADPAENGNEAAGSTVTTGLPGAAQQAAAEIAAGKAQALGKVKAALQGLARAATQPQLPASAADQARLATGTTPSAAAWLGANGAASRVEVTPAAVVAQPNAALGGGAAAAALAAEAARTATTQANQSNTTAAAAQTGQTIAADPTTAAAAQLQNRSSGAPGGNGTAPGGQANPGAGETTAQGTPTAPGSQDGDARVRSGPTANAPTLATSPEPGAATNASIPATAERVTANPQNPQDPRNAQTPFADSRNARAMNLDAQTAAAGTRNGLAQNARTEGAQTQSAQSQGAPVRSGETVEAAAEHTTARIGLPQSAQAQKFQQALPEGTQSAATEGARANAPRRSGQAIGQATTGTANATAANATAANATAKVMDRAVAPGPVQPAEGGAPTSANPSGAGALGLMQAAARISAMMPAQARPAAASPVPLDQVTVHIHRAAAAGQDRIRIRLHPAELGQIDVKLKFAGDGVVKAIITVDRPETFELLQRDARGLEKALQDAGLKTDSGSLSFNLRGQAQYGSDAGRGGSGFEAQGHGTGPEAEPQIDPQHMAAANSAGSDRLLDMRV